MLIWNGFALTLLPNSFHDQNLANLISLLLRQLLYADHLQLDAAAAATDAASSVQCLLRDNQLVSQPVSQSDRKQPN